MDQRTNLVHTILLLAIGSVLALELSMADEPRTGPVVRIGKFEPVTEDTFDFEKQFPRTYNSPLHGIVYLAAGQVDVNAPEPLTDIPIFMAFEDTLNHPWQENAPDPKRSREVLRSSHVQNGLTMIIVPFTGLDVSVPEFDVNARYGAIVSFEEDGVRYYELVSFKLDPPEPDFPVAMPGEASNEIIALVKIE